MPSMKSQLRVINVMVQNQDTGLIDEAARAFSADTGIETTCHSFFTVDLDSDPLAFAELSRMLEDADFLVLRHLFIPRRFKRLPKLEKILSSTDTMSYIHCPNPEISDMYSGFFKGTPYDRKVFDSLLKKQTYENEYSLLCHIGNILGLTEEEIVLPAEDETDGIYSAGEGTVPEPERYLESLDPKKATAGILFRTHIKENYTLEHIDALIRALEDKGFQTIPVFFPGKSRKGKETFNSENVVRRYFMDGDRSRIDVLIVMSPFSMVINSSDESGLTSDPSINFLRSLTDVPVIQALTAGPEFRNYTDMGAGVRPKDVVGYVAWPEIDGQIISVPIAVLEESKGGKGRISPLDERIDHLARLAWNWSKLRRKAPAERRIAILVYQKRLDNGRLGSASGLDTMESIVRVLRRLSDEGYDTGEVPRDGRGLLDELLSNVTNDFSSCSDQFIDEHAAGFLDSREYRKRFDSLHEYNRSHIIDFWGEPPGRVCTSGDRLVIPGIVKGNVLIGIQPPRSWEDNADRLYHDPILPPQHQFIAFYQWLRDVFQADAVIHMGTHGSLEWLPGKNTGLSKCCYPDLVLNALPDIYPYIIDNPGEGIQAKRRAEAVLIGYAAPTMKRSELYDELEVLDSSVRTYLDMRSTMPGKDQDGLLDSIWESLSKTTIPEQMGLKEDELSERLPEIEDMLEETKDTLIPDGLHILGEVPGDEETKAIVLSSLRVRGTSVGSLRDAVADALSIDREDVDAIDAVCIDLVDRLSDNGYDAGAVEDTVRSVIGRPDEGIASILSFVCGTLVPNIMRTGDEMESLVHALNGGYIVPGPPGAVSRGSTEALPTGRNIYGIDPNTIPSRNAWANGVKMADAMLQRYIDENGCYPRNVAFIVWATDTMKTGGDDIADILWLMGVRPVWAHDGRISGLEAVSLEELGRPRIDVSVRITGLFRDSFPNIIGLINEAVGIVSSLDETDEENYLASNLRNEISEMIRSGVDEIRAKEECSIRVFGGRSGSYGGGLNHAIEDHDWKDIGDLARMYTTWGGCGFAEDGREIRMEETFVRKLTSADIGVKNMPDRQMDVFSGDDVYAYLGGLSALKEAATGRKLDLFVGDGSDPDRPKVRTASEECGHVMRARVLNPRYIEGLRRHGFQGVADLARVCEYMLGWDAASGSIDDWMFHDFADMVLSDENREWMNDENPFSMMEILRDLMEAVERGLWDVDEEMRRRLEMAFLETEGRLEEVNDRGSCPDA